jgi:hypothetical protein
MTMIPCTILGLAWLRVASKWNKQRTTRTNIYIQSLNPMSSTWQNANGQPIALTDANGIPYLPGQAYKKFENDGVRLSVGGVWRYSGMCTTDDNEELLALAGKYLAENKTVGNETYGECRRNLRGKDDCAVGGGKNVMCQVEWPNQKENADCCAGLRRGLGQCGPYSPNTPDGIKECSRIMRGYCSKTDSWSAESVACPNYCRRIIDSRDTTHTDYNFCQNSMTSPVSVKPTRKPNEPKDIQKQGQNKMGVYIGVGVAILVVVILAVAVANKKG